MSLCLIPAREDCSIQLTKSLSVSLKHFQLGKQFVEGIQFFCSVLMTGSVTYLLFDKVLCLKQGRTLISFEEVMIHEEHELTFNTPK